MITLESIALLDMMFSALDAFERVKPLNKTARNRSKRKRKKGKKA